MKELKLYQCEICGTQYANLGFAQACEKSHKAISSVKATKYRSMKSNPGGYPDHITATFEDGTNIRYVRG